jgi:hypothetical protein
MGAGGEMTAKADLLKSYQRKILKSLNHLEYSFKKVQHLSPGPDLSDEDLETWESCAARLSRAVDLFLTKFIKLRIKQEDPGFDGSLRDYCNLAEKLGLIEHADVWMSFRELRNSNVHDYEENELVQFHKDLVKAIPAILSIRDRLK